MQLLTIPCAALASAVIRSSASPIRHNQDGEAKQPPQILEGFRGASYARHDEFHAVSPPPKVVSTRSDNDFSMSGNIEREFDTISPPPKVLPPRSDSGEFSMSGVFLPPKVALSSGGKLPLIQARKDGFLTISPPPKTAPGDASIGARNTTIDHFQTITPPPKTLPSDTKLHRRVDIWSSGFIGNVINK